MPTGKLHRYAPRDFLLFCNMIPMLAGVPMRYRREKGESIPKRIRFSDKKLSPEDSPIVKRSTAQRGTRQAGWSATAVDADLAAGESTDVESGFAQAIIRLKVFFDRKQTLFAE